MGEIIGLLATGILADRFGYRKTIAGGLLLIVSLVADRIQETVLISL